MAPELGAYTRDKMSDPVYKSPPTLLTSAKVAKQGTYMLDTTVLVKVWLLSSRAGGDGPVDPT